MNSKQRQAKKARLVSIYGPYCWHCKCFFPTKDLTLDHLIPKSKGGSNLPENLWLACVPCNRSRGNSPYPPRRSFRHLNQFPDKVVRKNAQTLDF